MADLIFGPEAFKHYIEWQTEDKKTLKRINELIRDIQRNGLLKGIGKPEVLRHVSGYSYRGFWLLGLKVDIGALKPSH
jgi:toxin YoeB